MKRECQVCGAKLVGTDDDSDPANYYCAQCLEELAEMVEELDAPSKQRLLPLSVFA